MFLLRRMQVVHKYCSFGSRCPHCAYAPCSVGAPCAEFRTQQYRGSRHKNGRKPVRKSIQKTCRNRHLGQEHPPAILTDPNSDVIQR